MLTIFTTPRPFRGPFDVIQRNAIKSWLLLRPKCEIILFNDEENTTPKVAKELNLKHIDDNVCNEFGTPLLDDVFEKVKKAAKFEILVLISTDIILMNNFIKTVREVKRLMADRPFFMTGRRWDLDVKESINFSESDWEDKLRKQIKKEGRLHGLSGMDYWVFPRNFPVNPPSFVVGRPGVDNWMVYKSRCLKIPVIDATEVVTIVHQNHNYPRKRSNFFEVERRRNLKLAGGFSHMCSLRDADWILTKKGLARPDFPRIIFANLSLFYPWRLLLSIKRKIQQLFR